MTFLQKSLLSSDKRQILFLLLAVFIIYLPAVWGPINAIDDPGIMKFYSDRELTLLDVLSPGAGYYYRPLIALNFYLDYHLFGQNSYLLHLENVLIHAANAALLFLLARRLAPCAPSGIPLAASLLFAFHPVNAEAVNWIAGRTDPLAALFVLLSALCLCRGLESGRARDGVISVVLLCAAALAKETALLFIPGSFLLIQGWLWLHPEAGEPAKVQRKTLLLCYLAIGVLFAFLFVYRNASQTNSVTTFMKAPIPGGAESLLFCLKVAGFYLKKLAAPWPLNIGIDSVAPWYVVPALVAAVLVFSAPRRNPYSAVICVGLLFLVPALVVALFNLAWTPVAERYLYIPSLFLCLGGCGQLTVVAQRMQRQKLLAPLLVPVLVVAAVTTVQRTAVWQSNVSLYQDAVAKSPDFAMLRNTLAVALIEAGRIDEAQQELNRASSLGPSDLLRVLIRRNRMQLAIADASPEEKRRFLNKYGRERSKEDTELLEALRNADNVLFRSVPAGAGKEELSAELIEVNDILYRRSRDPLLLYNNGQLHLARGDRRKAVECFSRSYLAAPESAHYRVAAQKLAEKLGGDSL